MVTQHIILDMTPGTKPIVNVSQYDTGARTLVFHLRQNRQTFTPPEGCTGILHGIKPDATYFSYAVEIDGDTVIADCTEQMTACVGFAECEVRLSNTEGHVGSANFLLNCEKSPMTGAIISDTDIPLFEQLATRAEQAAATAISAEQGATESAEAAAESATNAGESADRAAREAETASQAAEEAGESATAAANSASSASGSEASARGFAEQAEQSANDASESAQGAAQGAQTASAKASEAAASADRASGWAVDSATAANLASGYADTARTQAQAAGESATNAAASASTAQTAAATATTKAGEASASAIAANTSAGQATSSASAASTSAGNASASATAAATSAGNASDSASAAAGSASDASDSADSAAASARAAAQSAADIAASAAQIQTNTDNIAALQIVESTEAADITSIDDGADGVPMKSLTVYIEPVQDLHGQDAPYPPGGGKNKLKNNLTSQETNGLTVTVDAKGVISFSGTTTAITILVINSGIDTEFQKNTGYVLSGCTGGSFYTYRLEIYKQVGNNATNYNGDTQFQIYDTDSGCICRIVIQSEINMSGIKFYPMIRLATETDATFAPYSNICPISGWDGVEVTRNGVNQWDEEWEVGRINDNTGEPYNSGTQIRSKNFIPVTPNTTYYLKYDLNGNNARIAYYDANKTYLNMTAWVYSATFTTPINAHYIKFFMAPGYGVTYNDNISINYPSTDHDYHPYTGQTIPITLPGTVYGGVLDVISGELIINRAMVDLGSFHYTLSDERYPRFRTDNEKPENIKLQAITSIPISGICETFSVVSAEETYRGVQGLSCQPNGDLRIYAPSYSDVDSFQTAMNGIMLCYEIATPTTYTLTPEEVTTLLKANNIFADAGQTAIVYVADPKTYIDNAIADAVASLT